MAAPIDVIGIGADGPAGLRPELVERIRAAEFLAGGERHLAFFPNTPAERFVIKNNLDELGRALTDYRERRCVVLASGDPGFFGVAHHLLKTARKIRECRVEPTVSSMQLAFARAGISWDEASLASVHGRDLRTTLLPLLGRRIIGLFTQDGTSPATVASFFLERGLDDYEAFVGENLGAPDERYTYWRDLAELSQQHFAPLNYLILQWIVTSHDDEGRIRRDGHGRHWRRDPEHIKLLRSMVPGVVDQLFLPSSDQPHMLTSQEVRAVVLAKLNLRLNPGDVVWDIGAGLGSIAIEVAVLRPEVEVVAVESDPNRAKVLRKNREAFGAWNVRLVEGKAPEALADEELPPQRVFIGGSGGQLPGILDMVRNRLTPLDRLVANFVTLEHLMLALERIKSWGWRFKLTELNVSRNDSLATLTSLKPQRPVFILEAWKHDPELDNA